MHSQPKTPSRSRARSEAKTPLTPSLMSSMNNISLASPTKRSSRPGAAALKSKPSTGVFDVTNPFISSQSKSRCSSPVKRIAGGGIPNSDSFQRQASGGVIRKGGVESRLDVVTRDYVPPPKHEVKRSKSTPASVRVLNKRLG